MKKTLWKPFAMFVVLVGITFLWPMTTTFAAPDLHVSVKTGLDQKTKDGKGAPVVFTIENKGTAFAGDLIVNTTSSQEGGVGQSTEVAIGEGEKQTVTMIVDSIQDPMMYGNPVKKNIFFYENGWRSGEEITHSGTQLISSSIFPEQALFIAALSDNIDRLSSLKDLYLKGKEGTQLLNLTKQDQPPLPVEEKGWDAVDIIAVDGFSIADLSKKQQEAMLEWVKTGGTLLIGGSQNVAAEAGIFRSLLPLDIKESKELAPSVFNEKFKDPVPGFRAEKSPEGNILLQHDDTVLAASRLVGSGMVLQTAFSMGSESFRGSTGVKTFWTDLLNKSSQQLKQRSSQMYYTPPTDDLRFTVGETNELFPSFRVSTPLLFGIIIAYIILVIPFLYFLLRKKDKREHAWWVIPMIAIVVSFAIFAYGGKDRLGISQLQHSAVYLVEPDKSLTGYYAESLLTDKSGEFTFSIQKPSTVNTNSTMNSIFGGAIPAHESAILEKGATEEVLSFKNLGFWNVASIYGQTELEAIGSFDTDLKLEDNRLTGTITNNFPFSVKDVSVLSGSKTIELGSIRAGETMTVEKEVKATALGARSSSQYGYMNPVAKNQEDLVKMRKEGLLNFSSIHMNDSLKPTLSATTDTQIMELSLNDRKAKNSPISMLLQPIEIEAKLNGKVTVDGDLMEMQLLSSSGYPAEELDAVNKEYLFSEKEYSQVWQMPKDFTKEVNSWTKLQLFGADFNKYDVSLLNVKTGSYELLEGKSSPTVEPAGDYVSKDGKVTIKLNFTDSQMGESVHPPELRLTGEVAK
ncbi:hypothetical protein [Sporosarcina gallistercoris]|uniref:DUF4350 domain-containing protein n=1 Tax=Sporosarcina gallistercoris TaxID=2762245 RepID=A0ABR8PGJ8_9BACL|nr:hypothetical protein [Sporosarcina gallistercoris]MBD7907288.1 hypothetical protein [Sporosarcina gallistercoris]